MVYDIGLKCGNKTMQFLVMVNNFLMVHIFYYTSRGIHNAT